MRLSADCVPFKPSAIFEEAKFLVSAEVLETNFKDEDFNPNCNWKDKLLVYKINITDVIGGKIPVGQYQLEYRHNCYQKPQNQVFKKGAKYILGISKVNKSKVSLVDLACNRWGWEESKRRDVIATLKSFCALREQTIEQFIENSRSCDKDEDCDYIAYSAAYTKSSSCHRFINRNKISEINTKIKTLYGGLCEDPPLIACKAPLKESIRCKNKKCSFP